jgi:very-short-patch-repair endonuclease
MRDAFPGEGGEARCAAIAAAQYGIIHRSQAIAAGLSPGAISRRCHKGVWLRVLPRTYAVAAAERSWIQRCMAAALWAGTGAVLGYSTAACLLGLCESTTTLIHVVALRSLKAPNNHLRIHRPSVLEPADVTRVRRLPVTSPTRTLLDCGGEMSEAALEEMLDAALRRRLTTAARVRWQLEREGANGRGGSRALRRLIEQRTVGVAESPLETRFLRLVRRFQLPSPEVQHVVRDGARQIARVDFAYPQLKVAIELDGYEFHSSRPAWARDRERANDLVRLGWSVLRFTWDDVNRGPEQVARVVRQALRSSSP